jgi:hypothetical protein
VKKLLTALALTLMLAAPLAPARAADSTVALTLDGRPVDTRGPSAMKHAGTVYGNVVNLTKTFDGLLTFQGNAVVVTINGVTGRFTEGSRTALVNDGAVTMPGRAYRSNGDFYVPLDTFVTRVAKAKLRLNAAQTRADIFVNTSPS